MIHSTSFGFCLLFIFSVSTQWQHRIQAPSLPSNPILNPSSFFQELPSFPSFCFLPRPLVSTLGALACAACVCVGVRVCACTLCVQRVCVGVKASLCMLAGIGSNPGVPFTHLLWNQQSGFQAPSPSTKLSLCPTQPTPTLSLARPPSPHPYSPEEAWFSYGKERARVQALPPPPCSIYLC